MQGKLKVEKGRGISWWSWLASHSIYSKNNNILRTYKKKTPILLGILQIIPCDKKLQEESLEWFPTMYRIVVSVSLSWISKRAELDPQSLYLCPYHYRKCVLCVFTGRKGLLWASQFFFFSIYIKFSFLCCIFFLNKLFLTRWGGQYN